MYNYDLTMGIIDPSCNPQTARLCFRYVALRLARPSALIDPGYTDFVSSRKRSRLLLRRRSNEGLLKHSSRHEHGSYEDLTLLKFMDQRRNTISQCDSGSACAMYSNASRHNSRTRRGFRTTCSLFISPHVPEVKPVC